MRLSLFVTCLVDLLEPDTGVAAVRLLRASGCEVSCPAGQTCCGQPAWNSGFAREAASVARTTLQALEADLEAGAEIVVVPAGSCATMIRRFWPEMFTEAGDLAAAARATALGVRTRELTELLAERAEHLPAMRLDPPLSVAYHHSCHMLRELGLRAPPGQLLDRVEGCTQAAWAGDDRCCGFGGLFSVRLPEASVAMADEKLETLDRAEPGADLVVGADGSCLLHLRSRAEHAGRPVATRHIACLLADALPSEAPA
jgi:L-lactate dehydrogenase complex protein LldE